MTPANTLSKVITLYGVYQFIIGITHAFMKASLRSSRNNAHYWMARKHVHVDYNNG